MPRQNGEPGSCFLMFPIPKQQNHTDCRSNTSGSILLTDYLIQTKRYVLSPGLKMTMFGKECKHIMSTCDRPGTVLDTGKKNLKKQTKYTPYSRQYTSVIKCVGK